MMGRCPECEAAISVSDYAETYTCRVCGDFGTVEYLRPLLKSVSNDD